jgi:hypothetical protein
MGTLISAGGNISLFDGNGGINYPNISSLNVSGSGVTITNPTPGVIGLAISGSGGSFVPYTGATANLNLGAFRLLSTGATISILGTDFIVNGLSGQAFRINNADLKTQHYQGGGINYPSITFASATTYGFSYGSSQIGLVTANVSRMTLSTTAVTFADTFNMIFNTATGTKLGTTTAQKLSFWNATPIIQPTTAVTAATFVANAGTTINSASTFDGYTIAKVVKALRNTGLLA